MRLARFGSNIGFAGANSDRYRFAIGAGGIATIFMLLNRRK